MAIIYNGNNVTRVTYNGNEVNKVVYNGNVVWESSRTYKYLFAGVLSGESSGISGSYPNGSGNFRVNSTYGAMWCVSTGATDANGSGTTFAQCMQKNITSMKLYVYRNNTQSFNSDAVQTAWIYNPAPSAGGAKALIMDNATLTRNGYTYVNTATPVPTTAGLVQCSLTTAQLKACFTMTPTTISAAAGHSPTQIPAGKYNTIGLRGLYSNTPQFTWLNNGATYGYIEIVAG